MQVSSRKYLMSMQFLHEKKKKKKKSSKKRSYSSIVEKLFITKFGKLQDSAETLTTKAFSRFFCNWEVIESGEKAEEKAEESE